MLNTISVGDAVSTGNAVSARDPVSVGDSIATANAVSARNPVSIKKFHNSPHLLMSATALQFVIANVNHSTSCWMLETSETPLFLHQRCPTKGSLGKLLPLFQGTNEVVVPPTWREAEPSEPLSSTGEAGFRPSSFGRRARNPA
jgi:hypothetical protein